MAIGKLGSNAEPDAEESFTQQGQNKHFQKENGFEGFVKISICKTGYAMDQKPNFTGKKKYFSSLFQKISFKNYKEFKIFLYYSRIYALLDLPGRSGKIQQIITLL